MQNCWLLSGVNLLHVNQSCILFYREKASLKKNMIFLSRWGVMGEIEYHLETDELIELSSTFLNEKPKLLNY